MRKICAACFSLFSLFTWARAGADNAQPPVREDADGSRRASVHSEFGTSGSPPPSSNTGTGFDFGSYGRVGIGSDLRGRTGHPVNVVSFGSRLEKPAYLELSFYYGGTIGGGENAQSDRRWRVIFVPAFAGDLFHFTGTFSQHLAIRNAYAEVENLGLRGLTLWAGSRMARGDDVYLFDFWPLDNLNMVGGGAQLRVNQERTVVALQVGMNRLDDAYQTQSLAVPSATLPADAGVLGPQAAVARVTVLDRPRLVVSSKLVHHIRTLNQVPNAKLVLYGEFHYLPAGEREALSAPLSGLPRDPLPDDHGYVIGLQFGGWVRSFVFANLFVRHAGGLAVFGDLGKPSGFDTARQVRGARDVTAAVSANYEGRHLGVMMGGYYRFMTDASTGDDSGYSEGAAAVRPVLYWGRYVHTAAEFSYQVRKPHTADGDTGRSTLPMVARVSLMPLVAPLGRGTYSRPMIYGLYTLSYLTEDAQRALFLPQDVRANQPIVHYLGLGAEWWFNSSYR